MLSVPEVSQLFDDIMKAASKKAEPIICNVVLMNAGRQTEVSMAIALALQYAWKHLNLVRMQLSVLDSNLPAIRAYEAAGFCREGRLKRAPLGPRSHFL